MKHVSRAPSRRRTQRVYDDDPKPWPANPPGYTFLGDVVREVYARLFPGSVELFDECLYATLDQIREDALAGRLALGHFDGDAFVVLAGADLRPNDWRQLCLSCSVAGAEDVFVRDRELDAYVKFLDRVKVGPDPGGQEAQDRAVKCRSHSGGRPRARTPSPQGPSMDEIAVKNQNGTV